MSASTPLLKAKPTRQRAEWLTGCRSIQELLSGSPLSDHRRRVRLPHGGCYVRHVAPPGYTGATIWVRNPVARHLSRNDVCRSFAIRQVGSPGVYEHDGVPCNSADCIAGLRALVLAPPVP